MKEFLGLPAQVRRNAFVQMEAEMGLQAISVEKDFWVCWTLRELFTLPQIGEHLTFKGGTSLSKAWNLIKRFSEDIDIIVDKEMLGFTEELDPENAPSNNKRKEGLENLMARCRIWVQKNLLAALQERLGAALSDTAWQLEVDPDMADGQCLLFHYPSVFERGTAGYVRPVVKIELGARSDDWPSEEREVAPYVLQHFPKLGQDFTFKVNTLKAERTFWEKACLLHEESFRPETKPMKLRTARHYYDLWCLITNGVGTTALLDISLFNRVVAHRRIFFGYSWVDYSSHQRGTFRLVPSEEKIPLWKNDYQAMVGTMFFEDPPGFDEIMAVVQDFEADFNSHVS